MAVGEGGHCAPPETHSAHSRSPHRNCHCGRRKDRGQEVGEEEGRQEGEGERGERREEDRKRERKTKGQEGEGGKRGPNHEG